MYSNLIIKMVLIIMKVNISTGVTNTKLLHVGIISIMSHITRRRLLNSEYESGYLLRMMSPFNVVRILLALK